MRRQRELDTANRRTVAAHVARRPRQRRGNVFLLVAAIVLAIAGASILLYSNWPKPGGLFDMAGNLVEPDDQSGVSGPDATGLEGESSPDIGWQFEVPAVGLKVPLGSSAATEGVINPPGFQSVYWINNLGVGLDNAAAGTIYTATHSLRGGGVAPGNYLIDVDSQQAKVKTGDQIKVGPHSFTVTQTLVVSKLGVMAVDGLWDPLPRRLVVITCMQNPQNAPSVDNLVVIARLD